MADLKYYDIIDKPIITEKTMNDMAEKKYYFYVHKNATKIQIKEAIEKLFEGAKVENINTLNTHGKLKRRGRSMGYRPDRKKAVIQLTADSADIEIYKGM